jgi:hypothetical protein
MGVVNTTYTFTSTDTITSAKMNNIIDDTTFTSDAIQGTTLQVVSPGKLAVNSGGITSNELASNSVVTAAIADSNVTTAKIADASVTQAKLGANVAGNGPCVYAKRTTAFNVANATLTLVPLNAIDFDTGSDFDTSNYKFVAPINGYYSVSADVECNVGATDLVCRLHKNDVQHTVGSVAPVNTYISNLSTIVQMTSGDYLTVKVYHVSGVTKPINRSFMSVALIRSA